MSVTANISSGFGWPTIKLNRTGKLNKKSALSAKVLTTTHFGDSRRTNMYEVHSSAAVLINASNPRAAVSENHVNGRKKRITIGGPEVCIYGSW
jgi:hypothetical protein